MSAIRTRVSDIHRRLHQLRPTLTRRKNAATKKSLPAAGILPGPAAQFNGSREEPAPNQRDEAAQPPPGHQLSTYATAPAYETAPERSYETADEHRYHDKRTPVAR
jgi:hypothetical protein